MMLSAELAAPLPAAVTWLLVKTALFLQITPCSAGVLGKQHSKPPAQKQVSLRRGGLQCCARLRVSASACVQARNVW